MRCHKPGRAAADGLDATEAAVAVLANERAEDLADDARDLTEPRDERFASVRTLDRLAADPFPRLRRVPSFVTSKHTCDSLKTQHCVTLTFAKTLKLNFKPELYLDLKDRF